MKKFDRSSDERFAKYVSEAIDDLPGNIIERLSNVAIVIEDEPSPEQRKKLNLRKGEALLGLYEGIPQTERGSSYQGLPDKITIFKNSIELSAETKEDIKRIVRTTVWHEVAHHFGMEEDEVKIEEKRRGY